MRNKLISSLAGAVFSFAASGLALAADMAVKAPPPAPAPVFSWTGFFIGGNIGGGWGHRDVTFTANDPAATTFFFVAPHRRPLSTSMASLAVCSSVITGNSNRIGFSVSRPISTAQV